jgi:hypothetical protein
MKVSHVKSYVLLIVTVLFTQSIVAQIQLKDCFVHYEMMKTPYFSLIDLKSGKVHYTTTLKQPPYYVKINEKLKLIYAQTRNYAYKINAETGAILTEYEFEPIKEQKKSDFYDPNNYLLPFALSDTGIGFYTDMNDQIQGKTKGSILYTYDIEKKTKKQYANLDYLIVGAIIAQNKLYYVKEQPYLQPDWNKKTDKSFNVVETPLDNFNPKMITIPTNFSDGKTSVSHENLYSISVDDYKNNVLKIKFTRSDDPTPVTPTSYTYHYDVKANKGIQISNTNYGSLDNQKQYVVNVTCPEKKPMPTAPETYVPNGYSRKKLAEMEKINDERLAAYQKELDQWQKETLDDSGCACKLFEVINGSSQEIATFEGTKYLSIYYDTYVLYWDGLEYHVYDMKQKKKIWSNSF